MTDKKKGPPRDMVQLYSGVFVPRVLHDELQQHVRARLPILEYGERLKAKEMVARDYYATLNPWLVGACVSHWERHRDLPLRFLGCPYCSVRYYQRT